MKTLLAFAALAGALLLDSIFTCKFLVPDRVKRFSKGLNRLLLVVPLLAVPVFAVLFLFVLKGRLCERICHAALVLALWLYAARFYWMLISFFQRRQILIMSVFGMIASAAAAIVLTPLDQYVDLLHSFMGPTAILPGSVLLIVFYGVAFFHWRTIGKRG